MAKRDDGLGEQVTARGPNGVGDTQTRGPSDMALESKPPTMFGKGGQGTRAVRLLGSRFDPESSGRLGWRQNTQYCSPDQGAIRGKERECIRE